MFKGKKKYQSYTNSSRKWVKREHTFQIVLWGQHFLDTKTKDLTRKKKTKKNYRLITLINMDVKLLNKILALIQQHIYTYISYIFIIYIMFIWLISWNKSHFVKCIINPTLTKWDLFQDTTLVKHCTEVLHQCNKAGKGNKEHID